MPAACTRCHAWPHKHECFALGNGSCCVLRARRQHVCGGSGRHAVDPLFRGQCWCPPAARLLCGLSSRSRSFSPHSSLRVRGLSGEASIMLMIARHMFHELSRGWRGSLPSPGRVLPGGLHELGGPRLGHPRVVDSSSVIAVTMMAVVVMVVVAAVAFRGRIQQALRLRLREEAPRCLPRRSRGLPCMKTPLLRHHTPIEREMGGSGWSGPPPTPHGIY